MVFRLSHERVRKLKEWWLTVAFVFGFILDNLTLGRVDQALAMGLLFFYIILAGASLALLYAAAADRLGERIRPFIQKYAPLATQFAFGNLISGTLVFYSHSGSWSVAWPFLALVAGVMVGNEIIHNRTQSLLFNLSLFFIGIFSYCVLFIPVFIKHMGPWVFLGSGVVALFLIVLYVRILRRIIPRFFELHLRGVVFAIGMIYCALNFFYFTNIIPPIPLSLQKIDIYHSVEKVEGGYRMAYEKAPWYRFWREADTTYHYQPGDKVYCFASVFAPTAFSLNIFHRWEYYDDAKGQWVTQGRVPYHIEGGSDKGYRGYSYIESVHDGRWRCTVETERGQALGRESFIIKTEKPRSALIATQE